MRKSYLSSFQKKNRQRVLSYLLMLFLLLPLGVIFGNTEKVSAQGASQITIYTGYFGYPYVEKAVISADEIRGSGYLTTGFYTMMDNGGRLVYADVTEGIFLQDLLYYADVDPWAVSRCRFTASDGYQSGTEYTADTLLGERYAYPNAAEYFIDGAYTDIGIVSASAIANYGMLSLQDNFSRVQTGVPYDTNAYAQTSEKSFRLMLGQYDPTSVVAGNSIQNINEIYVTYDGAPQILQDDISINVGESNQLQPSIYSGDEAVSLAIANSFSLRFSSSDPGTVEVDENGVLTPVSPGTAEITIEFQNPGIRVDDQNLSKTITVTVGEEEAYDGGNGDDGSGNGSGDGNGSGEGDGSGSGDGGGSGAGSGDENGIGTGDASSTGSDSQNGDAKSTDDASSQTESTSIGQNAATRIRTAVEQEEREEQTEESEDGDTEKQHVTTEGGTKTKLQVRKISIPNAGTNETSAAQAKETGGGGGGSDHEIEITMQQNNMPLLVSLLTAAMFGMGCVGMFARYKREF